MTPKASMLLPQIHRSVTFVYMWLKQSDQDQIRQLKKQAETAVLFFVNCLQCSKPPLMSWSIECMRQRFTVNRAAGIQRFFRRNWVNIGGPEDFHSGKDKAPNPFNLQRIWNCSLILKQRHWRKWCTFSMIKCICHSPVQSFTFWRDMPRTSLLVPVCARSGD